MLPRGLARSRRLVRRRGGAAALVVACAIFLIGRLVGEVLGGSTGALISFSALVMSLPAMPVLGMPAAGGATRLIVAIALSATAWWILGQMAAGRVSRKPVVGWREWTREFAVFGGGLWAGALGGLVLAALLLGAL